MNEKTNTYGQSIITKLAAITLINYMEEGDGDMPITVGSIRIAIRTMTRGAIVPSETTCIRLLKLIPKVYKDRYKLVWAQFTVAGSKGYPRLALFPLTKRTKAIMPIQGWRIFDTEREAKSERVRVMLASRVRRGRGVDKAGRV